jgi:hypothetical protein
MHCTFRGFIESYASKAERFADFSTKTGDFSEFVPALTILAGRESTVVIGEPPQAT